MGRGRTLYLAASLLVGCTASAPQWQKPGATPETVTADQMRQDDRYISECMHKKGYDDAAK